MPFGRLVTYAFLAGCLAACGDRGQLVMGFATDLPARTFLDHVQLLVTKRGDTSPALTQDWDLSGIVLKDYHLPGSFTVYADAGAEPTFDVSLVGTLDGVPTVRRDASLGILSNDDLFVRLTLVKACETTGCPASLVCSEGECVPKPIDPRTLPRYAAELVDSISCSSGTTYIDTSSKAPMPMLAGGCKTGSLCSEGTCLDPEAASSSSDGGFSPSGFQGGSAELYGNGGNGAVGQIDQARYLATATTLADGRVLVVGGFHNASIAGGDSGTIADALLYDPATLQFARAATPPVALGGHTATTLADGRVLFVGAQGMNGVAFIFDPATSTFGPTLMPTRGRYFHTSTLLADGRVLIYGGAQSPNGPAFAPVGDAEVFDPKTSTFTKVTPTNGARIFHAATLRGDGTVLITGGRIGGDNNDFAPSTSVESFDPTTNTFTLLATLDHARALHTATLLADGSVLLVGGEDAAGTTGLVTTELYDTPSSTNAQPPPIPSSFVRHQAVAIDGTHVLFVGGAVRFAGTSLQPAGVALLYDATANAFTTLPAPKVARVDCFAALLANKDVLVGGGSDNGVMGDGGTSSAADLGVGRSDGSASSDGGTTQQCNPVGQQDTICGSGMRCSVAGDLKYGPVLVSVGNPRCAPIGTINLGDVCSAPTVDMGNTVDDCAEGGVCMYDADQVPRCLPVCLSDLDCGTSQRPICVRNITAGSSNWGVCMPSCTLSNDPCPATYNNSTVAACRAVNNGGGTSEACMNSGALAYGDSCLETSAATGCGHELYCLGNTCRSSCDDNVGCGNVGTCKDLSAMPSAVGVCQ